MTKVTPGHSGGEGREADELQSTGTLVEIGWTQAHKPLYPLAFSQLASLVASRGTRVSRVHKPLYLYEAYELQSTGIRVKRVERLMSFSPQEPSSRACHNTHTHTCTHTHTLTATATATDTDTDTDTDTH